MLHVRGEITNTNCIVLPLARPGIEPLIIHIRGLCTDIYNTDAVSIFRLRGFMSKLVIVGQHQINNFTAISCREQVTFDEMTIMSSSY
jgi:hypothetical protein